MTLSLNIATILKFLKKLVLIISGLVLFAILLVSVVLFFLPDMVSSDRCKNFVETKISDALARPVQIKNISWAWKDGIKINNLDISDTPEFSDASLISIEAAGLDIHFRDLLHRKLNFSFLISNIDINIIRDTDGRINLTQSGDKEAPKEPQPAEKKSKKKTKKPFTLPVDIQSMIEFSKISVMFDDHKACRKYFVSNAAIGLKTASLKDAPLILSVDIDLAVDDQPIPHSSVRATVKNIFNKNRELNIKGVSADLSAALPGIAAKFIGDMSNPAINSDIRIDLASLLSAASPFLPDSVNHSDIKGTIIFSANTTGFPDDPVTWHTTLTADDLSVSGKLIHDKALGPGNLKIALDGSIDPKNEQLKLDSADITILKNSRIHAHGRVEQFKSDDKFIDMAIAPLYLDISELAAFIKPFMPKTLVLKNQPDPSTVSLDELRFTGALAAGNADVLLSNLDIRLPGIKFHSAKNTTPFIEINNSKVSVKSFKAALTDLFPVTASLAASIIIDTLVNQNKTGAISITGIYLENFTANAKKIKKAEHSGFGFEGEISLDDQLTVKAITISDQIKIDPLTQSISTRAIVNPDGSVSGSLNHFIINTPKLSFNQKPLGPLYTGCAVNLALEKFNLKQQKPLLLDISKFITRINMEDALSLTLEVNAKDSGNSKFAAACEVTASLDRLTRKIPSRLPAGITAAGNARVMINATGRRPKSDEIDALKTRRLEGNLDFIDSLTVGVLIDKAKLKYDRAEKTSITAGPITGDPVFEYTLEGKSGIGKLNAHLVVAGLTGLPGINSTTSIAIELLLSGEHDLLKSIDLHQQLSIKPLRIKEYITASIDGLDRIITQDPMPPVPAWISDAGGKITAGVRIPDCSLIKNLKLPAIADLQIGGKIDTSAELTVIPDKSVTGNFSMIIEEMNLALADTITADSVFANLLFAKSYQVKSGTLSEAPLTKPSTLSANVIQSAFAATSSTNATDIYRHIRYINKRMSPYPALSFKKTDIASGPFPLTIGESQVMLGFNNGLPNLDYFQFDLLDGTINGSLNIFKEHAGFFLNAGLNFSGINTAKIFPDAFLGKDPSEAKISGSLYAVLPVTDQLKPILENSTIIIEFTRIGSSALERLLYSLDPYENNEAIISQRRILKAGSPKKIRIEIKNGFLSMSGKIAIKALTIDFPRIRRLNIARIPGIAKFEDKLIVLKPIILILEKLSAQTLIISKKTGTIGFK
ncbi:MAG: AsmA family protein [Dissulfuribacterales bacterium]